MRVDHRRPRSQTNDRQLPAAGFPGRLLTGFHEATGDARLINSYGQMFTPFVSLRGDFADIQVQIRPGVSNYHEHRTTSDVARFMPTVGLEYRYPFINVQSWGTQTIEPIAQVILRPNETGINTLPNEDSQSLMFDATNLFRVNKFAGWDRVEGGGRLNAGVSYTAQFNRGGYFNAVFGQSYQIFGQNSYASGSATNTGLDSGLDTQSVRLCGADGRTSRTPPTVFRRHSASTRTTFRCSGRNFRPRPALTAGPPA